MILCCLYLCNTAFSLHYRNHSFLFAFAAVSSNSSLCTFALILPVWFSLHHMQRWRLLKISVPVNHPPWWGWSTLKISSGLENSLLPSFFATLHPFKLSLVLFDCDSTTLRWLNGISPISLRLLFWPFRILLTSILSAIMQLRYPSEFSESRLTLRFLCASKILHFSTPTQILFDSPIFWWIAFWLCLLFRKIQNTFYFQSLIRLSLFCTFIDFDAYWLLSDVAKFTCLFWTLIRHWRLPNSVGCSRIDLILSGL